MKDPFCGNTYEMMIRRLTPDGFTIEQVLKCVTDFYRRRITSFPDMENIPKKLRKHLESDFYPGLSSPEEIQESSDLSVKYLFRAEGNRTHEAILIPGHGRNTACVSTQSGCKIGCPFCQTGKNGFRGNLTGGEIINQVISIPHSNEITHVVFMGMGEPLDNLDEVLSACTILTSQWGLALSPGHITVSTVGLMDAMVRFLKESHCNLTLSLYSPFPSERAEVIPVEKVHPAVRIISVMKAFATEKKRRFSIAYLMMKGVNDSDRHLAELIKLLSGTRIRVNLLPYHSPGTGSVSSSPAERIQFFRQRLISSGISASVRRSRGEDISAACGMLAGEKCIK